MLYLKACPRCQGDMSTNRDMYGEYKECLQCGYMLDIEKPDSLYEVNVPARSKKNVAKVA